MSDNFSAPGSVTEYSSQSWFGRIGSALVGVVIGLLLVPGSIVLLAWNEGRAVNTALALAEGAGAVVDVGTGRVDPANQGRLVHVAGPLLVPGTLTDPAYGAAAPGAVKLLRHVEMFQWEQKEHSETRKTMGGGSETVKTYTYDRIWSADVQDSSKFRAPAGHENPPFAVRSETKVAAQASIGAFQLDRGLLDKLPTEEKLRLEKAPAPGKLVDGGVFTGADPQSPALGDTRVTFGVVHAVEATVIAQQAGTGFTAYTTRNGRTLSMVSSGQVPAAAMFKEAMDDNKLLTWGLRLVGVVLMWIGFSLIMKPAAVLVSVLPFLEGIVGAGVALVGLLLTVIITPIVIAIAWLAVRPLIGGGLLVAGAVAAFLVVTAMRKRRAAQMAVPGLLPQRMG